MSIRIDVFEGGRIALASLRSNRMRTVLTTVGIGVGVSTLLAILGIVQGLNASFAEQMSRIGTTSMQVAKFPWVIRGDWWSYRNRKDITPDLADAIRAQAKYVDAVTPFAVYRAEVRFGDRTLTGGFVGGTGPEYPRVTGYAVASGRFLTEADDEARSDVVVLGADMVEGLFPHSSPLGQTVIVNEHPFRVVGTLERKGEILGESQDLSVFVPFRTFMGTFGKRWPMRLFVAATSPDTVLQAEDELVSILRRARGTAPGAPDDFSINRPEQLANTYNELTRALYGAAVGVGFITLLVGGIGIMNIMLVSVRERTREIGVRRALGARKRTIVWQFLMEAASVSAVGGALGTFVGLSLAWVASQVTPLAASVQPLTIVFGVAFSAAVGLLFGIWPAARAARLDPVEALRYE
ncbi:MAG: ABC transporter permease [Myxococcaceae bacterium]|nr:ABC transporter permease [Myxococcaceae bacterium]MCI0670517.1 ABC transporter permease [Myxococcaceae bacterium]